MVFHLKISRLFRLFLLRVKKEVLPPLQSPRHSPRRTSHRGLVRPEGEIKVYGGSILFRKFQQSLLDIKFNNIPPSLLVEVTQLSADFSTAASTC